MTTQKSKTNRLRITYNAPVTLTFSLLASLILVLNYFLTKNNSLISNYFIAPGCQGSIFAFNWKNPIDYIRLFSHVLGHKDWNHLLSNLSFILLLGPLLEEKYGSGILTLMMTITALVTGVINACFIPAPLMGASGIAFMMILLASFASISKNEIPLSFILIMLLYFGKELIFTSKDQNIAVLAHLIGGICGSLFGFLTAPRKKSSPQKKDTNKIIQQTKKNVKKEKASSKKKEIDNTIAETNDPTVVDTLEF